VLLTACSVGLYASFLNQPLECPELRPRVADLAGSGLPQLVLRMGPGHRVKRSPRRTVMEVLSRV